MQATDLAEPIPSRYVVGIDLGTTNSAVCYVDTAESPWRVRVFAIPQMVSAGMVEALDTLPSFHFQPPAVPGEDPRTWKLPWQTTAASHVVGAAARDVGQLYPGRLIVSAKSWLCHDGVDRTAELLPWQGATDVDRWSPVGVSACYLRHIRQAWDRAHPDFPLAQQDIVLTLPASFDEVARELTVRAAAEADLPRVVLIEEPQAAFYAWMDRHREEWPNLVTPGQKILVCDVGGGTSDFTLIRVRSTQSGATQPGDSPSDTNDTAANRGRLVQFHRIAVGDHLILGGDNFDLALARFLEQRLAGEHVQLDARQWDMLVRGCRQAKETLLGDQPLPDLTVHLASTGSRLIGGGVQVRLTREEAEQTLVDGFFPEVTLGETPQRRQSGFQEFGLPYASDPAITRYLSQFLLAHRHADDEPGQTPTDHDPARPDLVLLNGGVFNSPRIRQRLLAVISQWFRSPSQPDWQPELLANDRLDLAVAHGAAYYGMVRRGEGVRIAAGLARSYYLGIGEVAAGSGTADASVLAGSVDSPQPTAVCVMPGSAQPGDEVDLPGLQFDLRISEPVEFPLFVSSTRLTDRPGQVVTVDCEQMRTLPPLRTALRTRRRSQSGTVPVRLHAHLTEIGTVELWCSQVDGDGTWRLQFDVRSATETDRVAVQTTGESQGLLDEDAWRAAQELLERTFGSVDTASSATASSKAVAKPSQLMSELAAALGMERSEWPMSVLRRIGETLLELADGRRNSPEHEARWLNLLGYALRPGYGMAVDDWRVTETWRTVQGKVVHGSPVCRGESWILWRRIAGGLPAGQQRALAEPLIAAVRSLHRRMTSPSGRGEVPFALPEFTEVWRLLASLEWLPLREKQQLGALLVDLLPKRKLESILPAMVWSLGRLGSRVPLYGPLNTVADANVAAQWTRKLMEHAVDEPSTPFAIMQLARCTGDRYRDLPADLRETAAQWLEARQAPEHLPQLLRQPGELDRDEQQRAFGESLPRGLQLRSV
jgi:molecular chaperone DnaK (HSP70)